MEESPVNDAQLCLGCTLPITFLCIVVVSIVHYDCKDHVSIWRIPECTFWANMMVVYVVMFLLLLAIWLCVR